MLSVTPINDTLKNKIRELKGICILTIQESNYQKDCTIKEILSLVDSKEIIKIRSEEITSKSIESLSVNLFEISILAPIKIFIIEDIDKLKADIQKKLFDVLCEIPECTIVILTAKALNKTNVFYKSHLKNQTLINGNDLKTEELQNWIKEELKKINLKNYPTQLLNMILQASENNIDSIKEIVNYLAIYIKDNSITAQEFEKLFPTKTNISDFKILDPIYSANYIEYITLLKQLLKNKSEFLLISILSNSFSKLLEVKYYQEQKMTLRDIALKTQMQDWLLKKNINILTNYTSKQLKDNVNTILKAEAKLKDRNLGIMNVFEELFFVLAPQSLLKRKKI